MSLKPALSGKSWLYAGLACIGLMWVLPFLYYPHYYPLAAFYQECGTAILGLCAMLFLLLSERQGYGGIPRIALLPVGFSLLILLQFPLGKGVYWGGALLAALYLLWAAMLVVLGQRMREKIGLPVLAVTLAAFLLAGAELSALFGVAHHYSWQGFMSNLVSPKQSAAMIGNIGQSNHFADYIALGLVSLGLLYMHWRMPIWQVALLAAPLLFVLSLTGSRSALLYLLCLAAMAWLWQRRDKANLPLLRYSLLLLLGFGLVHLLLHLSELSGTSGSVTSVERLIEQSAVSANGGNIRLNVWYEAWLIFTQHPLLGAGFGQFGWEHFLLGPTLHNASFTGRWGNAHNLVMQTAAEMGLAGLIVLLVTLVAWVQQGCRAPRSPYHWWGCGLLVVLGVHSMLEFPLWYAYFMGIAAFMLGVLDTTRYRLNLNGFGRAPWIAAGLSGILLLTLLMLDYRKLQNLNAAIPVSFETSNDPLREMKMQQVRDGLLTLRLQTLMQPYIEGCLVRIGWSQLADGRSMIDRRKRFLPEAATMYLDAILLARFGQHAEARDQMERAIWSFPDDFPVVLENKLRKLASVDTDSSRYPALLEFSVRKYEERQHADGRLAPIEMKDSSLSSE